MTKEEIYKISGDVLEKESRALAGLNEQVVKSVEEVANLIMSCKGHVLVTGAGTSRAVGQRFAHLLSCCGTPAILINASDCLNGSAGSITDKDIVYLISKGGQSAEINKLAAIARKRGAKLIAHTEKPDSPLGQMCDAVYHIVAPGDIDPYGMIATGSSLVNGAACDALCHVLLEMRGYSKDDFGLTHPEGAVGKVLESEK